MSWAYEGVQCYVAAKALANHHPLYRSWNGSDHFYTSSKAEYDGLPNKYKREGIACYVATTKIPGHTELYRLYKGKIDDHFYTTSSSEKNKAVSSYGYKYEGVVGYVATSPSVDHSEFYRAWNPVIGDHFYTRNVKEIDDNGPTRTANQLKTVLKNQLGSYYKSVKQFYADGRYFCPTEAVAKEIIKAAKVDQKRYISSVFDCDDFAHLLKSAFIEDAYDSGRRSMPYAMGIIWGSKPAHAMNFIVLGDGKNFTVRIIEPQTGKLHKPAEKKLQEIYLLIA
ncbi:MAG: hypothetical protein AMJ94_12040 [Deltaproteobacteria bacterium SM23_61]|nr:MAG: hypothetical protein AMJ94_12040 [Deltaproteobacteria bacterium SM23_61]